MDIIPLLRAFASDNLPPIEPWHGTTHRIDGIGRDALEQALGGWGDEE